MVEFFKSYQRIWGVTAVADAPQWDLSPAGSAGRLMVSLLHRKRGPCALFTAYFWTGEGWTVRNSMLVQAIVTWVKEHRLLWVATGDFQMKPQEFACGPYWEDMQAVVRAPDCTTCNSSSEGRRMDYFIIDKRLAAMASEAQAVKSAATMPHTPVWMKLQGDVKHYK